MPAEFSVRGGIARSRDRKFLTTGTTRLTEPSILACWHVEPFHLSVTGITASLDSGKKTILTLATCLFTHVPILQEKGAYLSITVGSRFGETVRRITKPQVLSLGLSRP